LGRAKLLLSLLPESFRLGESLALPKNPSLGD
jgi:hypothetical protein